MRGLTSVYSRLLGMEYVSGTQCGTPRKSSMLSRVSAGPGSQGGAPDGLRRPRRDKGGCPRRAARSGVAEVRGAHHPNAIHIRAVPRNSRVPQRTVQGDDVAYLQGVLPNNNALDQEL